ncbi:MAG TPA: LPS assembly protein LptD [Gammaproteobacteria bacterium]|nr:LPS assembly protein LptD [Gammaproteobacteria bacterium]
MARQALAQDLCLPEPPPAPLPSAASVAQPAPGPPDKTIVVESNDLNVGRDSAAEFSNQVTIHYQGATINAESATFDRDNVEALGSVTLTAPDVVVRAEDLELDAEAETMQFSSASFDLPKRPARGSGEHIKLSSAGFMSVANVLFTTCPVNNKSWELSAREIDFDMNAGLGTAHGVKLDFKGVPILYSPYFSFPIDNQRKSGFLTPSIGQRDRTGLDLAAPYYFNLAPNYDLLVTPRYMSKRGMQVNNEFRYLLPASSGQLHFEYLPDDREVDASRHYLNFRHDTHFGDDWRVGVSLEDVSDDTYFEDLRTSLAAASVTHLNRYVDLTYYAPSWSMLTRVQDYQTIDSTLPDDQRPYQREPQMLFAGRWLGPRIGFDSQTELVNFDRNVGVTGWRLDSTEEFSMRFARSGMYLTPAVAWRQTNYWLDDNSVAPGTNTTPSRGLSVTSLDTGMRFEREAGDSGRLQTLEPRLLYVHVPFVDQSQLPVFDTITPDFNLVQLFRKYQFVGPDRVADTNQVSFGVTTRLIDSKGSERLTATLGQTRYLEAQHVSLPGVTPNSVNASDYVAEMSLDRNVWNLDLGFQWNSETNSTARAETRFEYRPQNDRLFGFGYRFRQDLLEQGDVSVVWPVAERWRIIGSYSYSFLESQALEQFLGWEYDACCWRFRTVARRYVSRTGQQDSAIQFQLELKGLSQNARAPEDLLDRGILGYRSVSQSDKSGL